MRREKGRKDGDEGVMREVRVNEERENEKKRKKNGARGEIRERSVNEESEKKKKLKIEQEEK